MSLNRYDAWLARYVINATEIEQEFMQVWKKDYIFRELNGNDKGRFLHKIAVYSSNGRNSHIVKALGDEKTTASLDITANDWLALTNAGARLHSMLFEWKYPSFDSICMTESKIKLRRSLMAEIQDEILKESEEKSENQI